MDKLLYPSVDDILLSINAQYRETFIRNPNNNMFICTFIFTKNAASDNGLPEIVELKGGVWTIVKKSAGLGRFARIILATAFEEGTATIASPKVSLKPLSI